MDFRSQTSALLVRSSSLSSSSSTSCISSWLASRVLFGILLLCLSLSAATPTSRTVLGQFDASPLRLAEADNAEDEMLSLLTYVRALLRNPRLQNGSPDEDDFSENEDITEVKRGFGIAGLDNVDMITSTLDRSRAMSRARGGGRRYLSSGLTFKQLRALMERAG
ncbi:uncharacterized protein LOC143301609 [Babylonia areolata]|uniref:uncharacterized protein LOC143301609 n=1 Tax=Babylonia areolata TaxID=304850 RepID=UPI003FD2563F